MSRNFNGTTDYITCNIPAALANLDSVTYAAWINPSSLAGDEFCVMAKGKGGSALIQLIVGDNFGKSNVLGARVVFDVTSAISTSVNDVIATFVWQFVAFTKAAGLSVVKLFKGTSPANVAEVSYQQQDTPLVTQRDDSGTAFLIGGRDDGAGGADILFAGGLGHPHVYNRDLSLGELQQIAEFPGSITRGLLGYWPLWGGSSSSSSSCRSSSSSCSSSSCRSSSSSSCRSSSSSSCRSSSSSCRSSSCRSSSSSSRNACWVAAELFGGWEMPKTIQARAYILNISPRWFRDAYILYGEDVASWLKKHPFAKPFICPLFEWFAAKGQRWLTRMS